MRPLPSYSCKSKEKTPVHSHINWRQGFVNTYSRKSKKSQLIHTSTGERGFQNYTLTKKCQLIHTSTDKRGFEFTYSSKIPVDLYINCRIRQTRMSNLDLEIPSWSQINGRPGISCIKVTPPWNYQTTFSKTKPVAAKQKKQVLPTIKPVDSDKVSPLSPHFKVCRQISYYLS